MLTLTMNSQTSGSKQSLLSRARRANRFDNVVTAASELTTLDLLLPPIKQPSELELTVECRTRSRAEFELEATRRQCQLRCCSRGRYPQQQPPAEAFEHSRRQSLSLRCDSSWLGKISTLSELLFGYGRSAVESVGCSEWMSCRRTFKLEIMELGDDE